MIWGAIIIFGALTLFYLSIIKWLKALEEELRDE